MLKRKLKVNMDVGIFDSGSGGLTVLKEIVKVAPNNRFIYLADSANMPYGNKTRDEILSYGDLKIRWMKEMGIDLLSIACNTTDSVIYDEAHQYKDLFKRGIVHIIYPTVKAIVEKYKVKKVGIIATEATANSKAFDKAFEKISNVETMSVPCPQLVPLIESQQYDYDLAYNLLLSYIKPLVDFGIDSLIYGCTHYKLLSHIVNDVLLHYNIKINLFDPATFVAEEISKLSLEESKFSIEFYTTDDKAKERLSNIVEQLFGFKPEINITKLC
jgi:glutamate racemase